MTKAWIVARHEFLVTVKRWWFIVATFVLPLVFLGVGGIMTLLAHRAVQAEIEAERDKPVGVVDQWGEISPVRAGYRTFEDEEKAHAAIRDGSIRVFVIVPPDYLQSGRVRVVTSRRPTLLTLAQERPLLPSDFGPWLLDAVLRHVPDERVARAKTPVRLETVYLDAKTGQVSSEDLQAATQRSVAAYAFFILLFVSIFTASAYLLQGMAEEKENRVMEMVLSAVTPSELMLGKLVGLGAAGLVQLAVWVALGIVGAAAFAAGIVLDPATFFFCFLFFLLGYVLYGSLMLGFGALGTNFRESQQMASVWSFIGMSPVFIVMALLEAPQGTLARVFSFIPFTSPTTMIFRYAIDPKGTPLLDILAAVAILVGSTWLAVKLSARLYRAGLLLYGKRPNLREIWRWIAAAR